MHRSSKNKHVLQCRPIPELESALPACLYPTLSADAPIIHLSSPNVSLGTDRFDLPLLWFRLLLGAPRFCSILTANL